MRTFQLAWISRRRTTMCPLSTRRTLISLFPCALLVTFQSRFRETHKTNKVSSQVHCFMNLPRWRTQVMTNAVELISPKISWNCCASNSCFDLGSWSGLAAAQSWLAALRLLLHSPTTARCQQHDGGLGSSAHCLGHHWTSLGLTVVLSPTRQVWDGFKTVLQVTSDQSRDWPSQDATSWGNHAALEKQGAEQPLTTGGIAGSICQGDQVEERDDLRHLKTWMFVQKLLHGPMWAPSTKPGMLGRVLQRAANVWNCSKNAKAACNSEDAPLKQPQKHFLNNRTSTPSLNIPCRRPSVATNCQVTRYTFSSPAISAGPWFSASLSAEQTVRPRSFQWGSCASMLCILSCMLPRCFPAALECSYFSQTGVLLCHFSFLALGSPRTSQYIHV